MAYTKQEHDLFSSNNGNVFDSVQKCFNNNEKLKTKILQFNSNVSSVIRDGCIQINNICNRVRQHLSKMEQREQEIYAHNDSSESDVCNHGDKEYNESSSFKATKTMPFKEVEFNTKETGLDCAPQTTDENESKIDARSMLNERLEIIPDLEEIQQQKEDKSTSGYASASTHYLQESSCQVNTKAKGVNATDETIKYNLMAEKVRNDEILKDVDESLRAISRVSITMNCLEKYERKCELLQEKIKHIAKGVHENLNEKSLVDTATSMSQVISNDLHIKGEESICLVEKATGYEVPGAVDESQIMISETCNMYQKYVTCTNTSLTNKNRKYQQVEAKLRVRKNSVEFAEPDSLRTDHSIDEIVDEVVDDVYVEIQKSPTPPRKKPQVSKSIQTPRMKETIKMMKNKLRQQKHISGSYFEEIKDTISTLSNNFDIVNKLVDSVNKDIVEFSKTASFIVKDSVIANFGLKNPRVNSRKSKRATNRSVKTKKELQDHSMALNKASRPITPRVIRKQATTDLRKKVKMEMGPKNTSIYKNVLAAFGSRCNYNICR